MGGKADMRWDILRHHTWDDINGGDMLISCPTKTDCEFGFVISYSENMDPISGPESSSSTRADLPPSDFCSTGTSDILAFLRTTRR